MPTNEYSRADFLRALLNQQRRNTAMGGSLLNPSISNGSDLETSATIDTTMQGNTPINGAVANFDVEKAREEQKQAGHTGNWFVDAMDNIFGFVDEIAAKFGAGFVGAWEGLLDLGATAIGAFGDWTGWYDSDPFTKWAQQDIGTAAAEWTKTYMNLNPWSWIRKAADGTYSNSEYWNDMFEGGKDILDSAFFMDNNLHDFREDADKYYRYNDEVLQDMGQVGEFLGGAAHSIGFMLPSIMTGGIAGAGTKAAQVISLGAMGLMAAGKGSEEALNEGANASQALGYGVASGAVEVASEIVVGKALGLVGLGTGKIMGVVGSGSTKTAVKVGSNAFVKELGKTMFEEGMEEVFSAVMEPVTKSIYKGKDAFKNTYSNPDWWFGTNGHFTESVVGQFASGAFVGGLSGAVQTAPVYKKLGATNYNTMQSFREVVELDNQMAKMEKQKGFNETNPKYQKLANERAEAMSKFIENMNTSMQKSTSEQNKYLAELLTNRGALAKALAENEGDTVVNDYLNKISSDYGTHERAITTSFFNEMQSKFGTDYSVEYMTEEEMIKQYGENTKGAKGFFDPKTNRIVLNDAMLKTHAGKVLAHEYFAHGISKSMTAGNVRVMFNDIIQSELGKSIAEKLRNSKNYNFKHVSNSNLAFQEEVLGHFLEQSFEGKNVATQLNELRKLFGENKLNRFIDNILDAFNKTEKFKGNKVVKEYAKVLNQWLKYGENHKNLTARALRKIVYKEYNGVELNAAEKAIKSKYSKIVDILESQTAEKINKEYARLQSQLAFSIEIKDGEKVVVIDNTEIVQQLKAAKNTAERTAILKKYLREKFVGKELSKPYADAVLEIKERGDDIRELVGKEHLDTSQALTQLDELLEASEFIGEQDTPTHKKNNHFWYFKTIVEIDNKRYEYTLNIGRNKHDGNIALYDLTNYKKGMNPYQVSSSADITPTDNITSDDKDVKLSKDIDIDDDEFDLSDKEKKELDKLLEWMTEEDLEDLMKETVGDKELWDIAAEQPVKPAEAEVFKATEEAIVELNEHITPEVRKYFKDSVIKSNKTYWFDGIKDGKYLIPMYHGTPSVDMYFFDSKRIGEHGATRGHGFYLTSSLELAKGYTGDNGKVIVSFLNITKPASEQSLSITRDQVKEFVRKYIDPTAEQGTLSNYGDVNVTSYEKILNKFVDGIFEYGHHSDLDLIEQLYREETDLDFNQFFRAIKKEWGFDGYLFKNRAEGTIAVAWFAEQIKDINNTAPTSDSYDIRYSKDIDGDTYEVRTDKSGKPFDRSPITYEGGKYDLLPDLIPSFPNARTFGGRFIDAFSGSLVVSMNVNYNNQTANELNPYTYSLQKAFKEMSPREVVDYIYKTIDEYKIRTQEGFEKFKEKFNKTKPADRNPLDLYILQKASSSGSLLWFDEKGNFKGNYVRGNFLVNKSLLREEITKLHNKLKNIELTNKDAIDIINEAKSGDFIYVDPPYSNTSATYNSGWTTADDTRLMQALDEAAKRGVGFALSNVFEYNGKVNKNWKEWAQKYSTQHLDKKYFKGSADEVLITFKGDYKNAEINTNWKNYEGDWQKGGRFLSSERTVQELFGNSEILQREKWSSFDGIRSGVELREFLQDAFSGKISLLNETDGISIKHYNNYVKFLRLVNDEGKIKILNNKGFVKPEFFTPEMQALREEYAKLGGETLEFNLDEKDTAFGYHNSDDGRLVINLINCKNGELIATYRHEMIHHFQNDGDGKFYHKYFEKILDKYFKDNQILLAQLRENTGHGSMYYDRAMAILQLDNSESSLKQKTAVFDYINDVRQRFGKTQMTWDEFKDQYIEVIASEYNLSRLYDEVLAETYEAYKPITDVYLKYGVNPKALTAIINDFREAVQKRYNTESIFFSKDIDSDEMEFKKKHGLTFKSIRTTEEIVTDTADYIESTLGKGYKVHFPDNFNNLSSKAFTEINSAKRTKTQAKHLVNILLDTQITQDGKIVGTLDELLDAKTKASLETAIEGIIASAPDTAARTKATLPFEKALDRAIRNVQNAKTLEGRNHVWQNLRNSVHNQYDRYLDLTGDSVAKGGYQPLLNIFNETHWNGTTGYKLGSLREVVETAIELYSEDSIKTNFGGLQYSPEIHDALLDLEASLPARKTITDKTGAVKTRDVTLDENTVQKLIDLGRLVKKQIQNQITRDATEIRPAVREGVKAIQHMSYSQRKGLAARMYRAWKRGFAPAYVVLEQMLGSNSTLSRKITYEMQMGFNKRQLYKGAYSDLINKKLKELGIKKNFDTKTFTIDGHKMSADQALSLYISLQVDINREEINNNGFQYILTESGKEMKLSTKLGKGEADSLKAEVERILPENYRKFGDFLLETMNDSVKSEYMKMCEDKYGKYVMRNEIGKIGDKSYWMLFRSYQKATNVEKAMRNPAGVFTHAKARVDTQNAVLINGALSSFMSYVDSLGSELYVKPIYRDVISILNTKTEQGVNGQTISQVLAETVGEKDFNYLMTSLADMLGVNPNKTNDMFSRAMSTFSVAKLSLNIGTMLKQFTSIWTSNIPMYKSIKGVFSNIFKSAEVKAEYNALVNEIGGLKYRESAKGVLLSNADSVGQFGEKIARVGMYGISKVDLFTVSSGVVSLMHIAQDQFGYKIGTEENKNWVKEHWTEFELSQIGNSALSKNAIARGDYGGITKAIFGFLQGANRAAFGSQLHKLNLWLRNRNVNIEQLRNDLKTAKDNFKYASDEYKLNPEDETVREEYINAKAELDHLQNMMKDYESYQTAGGHAIPVNAAMGLVAQGLFVAFINELMKHLKGKKDWDEWEMQDISLWALNILKTTFVDWVPFFNTITSALGGSFERDENGNIKIGKGYDVQVPVVEIFNDMVDLFNGFKSGKVDWFTIANIVGNMTGIPVSTITSYVYGTIKTFNPEIAEEMQNVLYGGSSSSSYTTLNKYVENGNTDGARKVINNMIINGRTGYVSERVLNELTKLYMNGYHALPREYMTAYQDENGQTVQLTAAQITAFRNIYQQSDKAVRDLLQVQEYQSLTQEEQAKLIKKIYDLYYDYAKIKAVGGSGSSKLSNLLAMVNGNINLGNLVAILNKVSQITENKRKTRKELVVEYINRQVGLSRQEKVLVMYLAGYGLNDKNKRTVKGYLSSKGASAKDIKAFLGE